jgi:hypothetical protein
MTQKKTVERESSQVTKKESVEPKRRSEKTVSSKEAVSPVKQAIKDEEEMLLQTLRGMRDILPDEQPYWERVRKALSAASQEYGFQRIDLPTVEFAHLYLRTIGEGTDILDKEIYLFNTRGGDRVALRPEMTAGLCRAYIEHGMGVLAQANQALYDGTRLSL